MKANGVVIVSDQYRTNAKSFEPGGSVVTAIYNDTSRRVYDKIKIVDRYVERLKQKPEIIQVLVDGEVYWTRN